MMKKIMFGALLLVLALSAHAGSAETCGRNVLYEYDGNTVEFSKAGDAAAYWGSDCYAAFADDQSITKLKIATVVYTESAKGMFKDAKYIKTMDLVGLYLADEATDMSSMFSGCSSLESLDLSGWYTERVTDMSSMFSGCSGLTSLALGGGWNTYNVTNMSSMFSGCSSLTSLDLSNWSIAYVKDMSSMFSGCSSLESLDLSYLYVPETTKTDSVFTGCSALHTLTLKIEFLNMGQFFSSLPDYNGPWYYAEKGADAGADALGQWTQKTGDELFTSYARNTMAGTWTTHPVKILDPGGKDITDQIVVIDKSSVTYTLQAGIDYFNGTPTVNWTSSDMDVASVSLETGSQITVTFIPRGKATITATVREGGVELSGKTTLTNIPLATSLKIMDADGDKDITGQTELTGGSTYQLIWVIDPEGADQVFDWSSSDTALAEVGANGLVSFHKGGTVTITAETTDGSGVSAWTNLAYVKDVTGITIRDPNKNDITRKTVKVNTETYQLTAEATPSDANQEFEWESGSTTIAEVDNGFVTFNNYGTVMIIAKSKYQNDKSDYTELNYVPPATSVVLTDPNDNNTVITGKTVTIHDPEYQLKAAAEPAEADQVFDWISSDTSTAAVDEKGMVRFSKAGTVTITADTKDGSGKSVQVTLKLEPKADPAEIAGKAEVIRDGNTIDLDSLVTGAVGDVSFSIEGEDLGCSLDPDSHVLTSGDKAGTVSVTVTVDDSNFHKGKTGTITVTVKDNNEAPSPEPEPGRRLFRLCEDCVLPATGFSSVSPTALREQPQALRYEPVRMRLLLPTLEQDVELVTVPREENSWAVDWLGGDAGILEGSAFPGEGTAVIAAHNTLSDKAYGPFALLAIMEAGDRIFVRTAEGDLLSYKVYANELLAPGALAEIAAIAEEGALVLVTCENESAEGGYLNRRVVFAK